MDNNSGNNSALDKFTENLNKTIQIRQRKTFDSDEQDSKPDNLTKSYLANNYSKQFSNFNRAWAENSTCNNMSNIGSIYNDENLN
jgi:hypothetical protein